MSASFASRTLLLSLVGLTLACRLDAGGTATDTDGSSGAMTEPGPTTDATDTDTTGTPVFPMCQEPAGPDNIGFEISGEGLRPGEDLDLTCTILARQTAPDFSATIDLTCSDAMATNFEITIDLQLFQEAKIGALEGAPQVRLLHREVDGFDQREVLALRDLDDDALLLFAARGHDIFMVEDEALWAPLGVSPVAEALCPGAGDCELRARTALDITLGEVTERVFDRDWTRFSSPALAVHVGSAQTIDRHTKPKCEGGDGPEGLHTTVVVIAEK